MTYQTTLYEGDSVAFRNQVRPFKSQLLKWIGNKQRIAHKIIRYFPASFGTYYEPFLGSGGVLGGLRLKLGLDQISLPLSWRYGSP